MGLKWDSNGIRMVKRDSWLGKGMIWGGRGRSRGVEEGRGGSRRVEEGRGGSRGSRGPWEGSRGVEGGSRGWYDMNMQWFDMNWTKRENLMMGMINRVNTMTTKLFAFVVKKIDAKVIFHFPYEDKSRDAFWINNKPFFRPAWGWGWGFFIPFVLERRILQDANTK